jgi:hypothetical protein
LACELTDVVAHGQRTLTLSVAGGPEVIHLSDVPCVDLVRKQGLLPRVEGAACAGSAERLRAIDKADVEMRHIVTADKKYWYLHALGTTPRLQKKGKASELVRVLSHLADLENVPMYVESGSHLNSLFYLKRGFIKKETIHAYPFSTSRALLRLPNNCSSSVQSADISIGNAKDTI